MRTARHPNILGIGKAILSDAIRIPEWWKKKTYQQMRVDWSHATLRESVRDDIMKGEVPPREVLDHFPELR